MTDAPMRLRLLVPAKLALEIEITQLKIEAMDGERAFLPHHQDFFTALPAGIVTYKTKTDSEHFVAIDHGLLVKCLNLVTLTTHQAILSDSLMELRSLIHEQFFDIDEQQKKGRTALARLEAGAIRQFINLEHLRHG